MLLDTDRDRNIVISKKMSIFFWTLIAVGHRIQGGSPGPLRLKYTVDNINIIEDKLHSATAERNPKKSPD